MSYTKGEWKTMLHAEGSPYYGNTIVDLGCNLIRTVTCLLKYASSVENEANAQLISAAPDLLEACKAALLQLNGDKPQLLGVSIVILEEAINKAGGK